MPIEALIHTNELCHFVSSIHEFLEGDTFKKAIKIIFGLIGRKPRENFFIFSDPRRGIVDSKSLKPIANLIKLLRSFYIRLGLIQCTHGFLP